MPEYKTEPFIVPSVSGLLPEGERNRRVALTSFDVRHRHAQVPMREVVCYECGRRSSVPAAALSAACIHCRAHLNMADVELRPGTRRLTIRTLGNVTVPADAVLSHLSIVCGNLLLEGRCSGSFRCSGTLKIAADMRTEGSVKAGVLQVNKGCDVIFASGAAVRRAELYGRVSGRLEAKEEVVIHRGAQLCGDCCCPRLTVEPGGSHLGNHLRTER